MTSFVNVGVIAASAVVCGRSDYLDSRPSPWKPDPQPDSPAQLALRDQPGPVSGAHPSFAQPDLPLKFDWVALGVAYWFVLVRIDFRRGDPGTGRHASRTSLGPLVARYREKPLRALPLILYFAILAGPPQWMKAWSSPSIRSPSSNLLTGRAERAGSCRRRSARPGRVFFRGIPDRARL